MNLNRKRGVAQLFVVAVMAFLALGLPLTTKLVQQNQENRSQAASTKPSGEIQCSLNTSYADCGPKKYCGYGGDIQDEYGNYVEGKWVCKNKKSNGNKCNDNDDACDYNLYCGTKTTIVDGEEIIEKVCMQQKADGKKCDDFLQCKSLYCNKENICSQQEMKYQKDCKCRDTADSCDFGLNAELSIDESNNLAKWKCLPVSKDDKKTGYISGYCDNAVNCEKRNAFSDDPDKVYCGRAENKTFTSPPDTELCRNGTGTLVLSNNRKVMSSEDGRFYLWVCAGGNHIACKAKRMAPGVCGDGYKTPNTTIASSKPTTGLCSRGEISKEGIRYNDKTNSWQWYCDGVNGGNRSGRCEVQKTTPTATPKPKTCSYSGIIYGVGKAICQGDKPAECLSTGSWKLFTACKYGCTGLGICKTAPTSTPKPVCSSGARVCSGSSLKICQNNNWQVVTNCQYGCLNGGCKAVPTPTRRPTATPTKRPIATPTRVPTPRPISVNGKCGSTRNACISGSFSDLTDSSISYLWKCMGKNGGMSVSCSLRKPSSGYTR